MQDSAHRAVAIVGVSSILPDAPDTSTFWNNVATGRSSISEVSPERWDPAVYWSADHASVDQTYSKIGGWVRAFDWAPVAWKLPLPPKVQEAMDEGQRWAVACARAALLDYGWPGKHLEAERTAVILGNAMGGERGLFTTLRTQFPEFRAALESSGGFAALPAELRARITADAQAAFRARTPTITEDSMPGELSNCLAGRICNLFDFKGPNFTTDAACASTMAALSAAVKGLYEGDFDVALAGGVDRNMGVNAFVKFSRIGALSATGSRPYADGADGFVMGEGAALFVLKRLADAERDGDRVYAVLRGLGGSSDGRGKGLTAPNPIGQKLAVQRAWASAGLAPSSVGLLEGHGTSTPVGDAVEVGVLAEAFAGAPRHSIALGSVKSNIGHLKAAAGAAGVLKVALALHHKLLPPSLNFDRPNPAIAFDDSPLEVNRTLRPWEARADGLPRRAAVSAFGFGGTNFHVVLEEHVPGALRAHAPFSAGGLEAAATGSAAMSSPAAVGTNASAARAGASMFTGEGHSSGGEPASATPAKAPLRGALLIGGANAAELLSRLEEVAKDAAVGKAPPAQAPCAEALRAPERLAIDYRDAVELADKCVIALKALKRDEPAAWKLAQRKGIFRGHGPAQKVAFIYPGQGSQYVGMLGGLRQVEPIVAQTFEEADRAMQHALERPLSSYVFADKKDPASDEALRQTAITQPAVLAADTAVTRLLEAYGVKPAMVMGHSLGEYGALTAAGALPFEDALEAVSVRGSEMTRVSVADHGLMAAVGAPLEQIEATLASLEGYAVVANVNSRSQAVIGGETKAMEAAEALFKAAGVGVIRLPVSHAFHTRIVAGASEPMRLVLSRLRLGPSKVPVVANVTGELYPDDRAEMLDLLARQVASPVQFVKGLETLYAQGARMFVEVGPKRTLTNFVEDVLEPHGDVTALHTNHHKLDDLTSFNHALCGLYAAGVGNAAVPVEAPSLRQEGPRSARVSVMPQVAAAASRPATNGSGSSQVSGASPATSGSNASQAPGGPVTSAWTASAAAMAQTLGAGAGSYEQLGRVFAEAMERAAHLTGVAPSPQHERVVITGAGLGLPGGEHVFDDTNIARILRGEPLIDVLPARVRKGMLDKHITRVVKSADGSAAFATIDDPEDVIKVAGRGGALDLAAEFGIAAERIAAFDVTTRLAIGAGLEALRDAGIPLVLRYKTTTTGSQLPDRWVLPAELCDDTGIIFASAFPGYDAFAGELNGYHRDRARREQLELLESLARFSNTGGQSPLAAEIARRESELHAQLEREPYAFNRRFLFRSLSMGHSQLAELIGARGPNTQINSACASTTQAVSLAQDWISAGRCKRVLVVAADDATGENLMEWVGSGFLASGAAATDAVVADAATPFDRRRHGMIIGMGAAALVVEAKGTALARGLRPICEVISTVTANSAFHGTRLDVQHISGVMERLLLQAEAQGLHRADIARELVFLSHETYTPARGGSAAAEVKALRDVFGADADRIVVANTKGFTGHPMAVGIEDVVAVKALETGVVPPIPNFKEPDPDLGVLNFSRGGSVPVEYALRLAAGFGSQISMTLTRRVPPPDGSRRAPEALGHEWRVSDRAVFQSWLQRVTGQAAPRLEVVQRTLRVKDTGAAPSPKSRPVPAQPPAAPPRPVAHAAAPLAAPPVAAAPLRDEVVEGVLQIITEKTGYGRDMLALDLDLEADLGIDTVKQAETFAAVRARWDIPREETLKLRDFPTLQHVVQFVRDRRPDLASAPPPAAAPAAPTTGPASAKAPGITGESGDPVDPVVEGVLQIITEKTGYARDMLELDLDLEADLGIDTVKQAETFAAVRARWDIPREETLKLRDFPTLRHVVQFVRDRRPDLASAPAPAAPPATSPTVDEVRALTLTLGAGEDPVVEGVLQIITEKTGYARDMLELDLDLEADLGIDTVKQAETFAAVRARWDIPREETLKLRDFPTLRHVVQFVRDRRPDLASAPAPAAPIASIGAGEDPIVEGVLQIITEKTGYARDMLELDLDLEADLGVDTVKQAETFAAVRARWDIPREETLKLRDFPTLRHVVQFVRDRRPDLSSSDVPAATATLAKARPAEADPADVPGSTAPPTTAPAGADAVPRRVPVPVLRPALALCKPTGVLLARGARVLVMPDEGGVAQALTASLTSAGVEVVLLSPTATTQAAAEQVAAAGEVQGLFWLPALDDEGELEGLTLETWHQALHTRVKLFAAVSRALYQALERPGAFVAAATRLGGQHGYGTQAATAAAGGAVVGFSKALARERSAALVKAVDFESSATPDAIAVALLEELARDPGAVEIGRCAGERYTVALLELPAVDGQPGLTLGPDSVFLVTGAAGSIVSAIVADLARASGGTFHLLDLIAEPDPANPDLRRVATEREPLKRELFERLKASGERATPALVERQLAALERSASGLAAIEAVQAAGGRAFWHQGDLRDPAAIARAVDAVRARGSRIDVLLHAGGLEISRLLPDKPQPEFDLVFDVKCDGWFNLLQATAGLELGATVAFSSIAGRFGNAGQTDYSAANDLLCKQTSALRRSRPATRGIVIDWTAWGGIGMAARGSIPELMARAGIEMLSPGAGIPTIRRELTAGGTRGELVIAGTLGAMLAEADPQGGLEPGAVDLRGAGPMIGQVLGMSVSQGLVVETRLDPSAQPFLFDHRIDGTPVLPGVMGLEAFAEAALLAAPGWALLAVEDVAFLAPFKFYRDEPRTLRIAAQPYAVGDELHVRCALTGERTLPGQPLLLTTHFRARVRLGRTAPAARQAPLVSGEGPGVAAADLYSVYFHGPAFQVLERAWVKNGGAIGLLPAVLPPGHLPEDRTLAFAPRLIELCFQTAGLREMRVSRRMALPDRIERVEVFAAPSTASGRLTAVIEDRGGGVFDALVIDDEGLAFVQVVGYRTSQFPQDLPDAQLQRLAEPTVQE